MWLFLRDSDLTGCSRVTNVVPIGPFKKSKDDTTAWRICVECGNRFETRRTDSVAGWCSMTCQTATYRSERDRIQGSWAQRARWWLR